MEKDRTVDQPKEKTVEVSSYLIVVFFFIGNIAIVLKAMSWLEIPYGITNPFLNVFISCYEISLFVFLFTEVLFEMKLLMSEKDEALEKKLIGSFKRKKLWYVLVNILFLFSSVGALLGAVLMKNSNLSGVLFLSTSLNFIIRKTEWDYLKYECAVDLKKSVV